MSSSPNTKDIQPFKITLSFEGNVTKFTPTWGNFSMQLSNMFEGCLLLLNK